MKFRLHPDKCTRNRPKQEYHLSALGSRSGLRFAIQRGRRMMGTLWTVSRSHKMQNRDDSHTHTHTLDCCKISEFASPARVYTTERGEAGACCRPRKLGLQPAQCGAKVYSCSVGNHSFVSHCKSACLRSTTTKAKHHLKCLQK